MYCDFPKFHVTPKIQFLLQNLNFTIALKFSNYDKLSYIVTWCTTVQYYININININLTFISILLQFPKILYHVMKFALYPKFNSRHKTEISQLLYNLVILRYCHDVVVNYNVRCHAVCHSCTIRYNITPTLININQLEHCQNFLKFEILK